MAAWRCGCHPRQHFLRLGPYGLLTTGRWKGGLEAASGGYGGGEMVAVVDADAGAGVGQLSWRRL